MTNLLAHIFDFGYAKSGQVFMASLNFEKWVTIASRTLKNIMNKYIDHQCNGQFMNLEY